MILVTGGTGKVGEELVKKLRETGASFRVASRSPQKVREAEAAEFDFDRPETFGPALRGVDTLFLLSPAGTEREEPVVDAANAAGVRHIVKLSVWGADTEAFVFGRAHRSIEKRIEAAGVPWTFLRPNGFMQNFVTPAVAGSIRSEGAFYQPAGDSRYSIVDVRDVAEVAARVLMNGGSHAGKAYRLSGSENLSNRQMAEKLSAAIGRNVAYIDVPEEDFKKGMVGAGAPESYADAYIDLIRYYRGGKAEEITPDVERVTGRPPTFFDQFAGDYASVWK